MIKFSGMRSPYFFYIDPLHRKKTSNEPKPWGGAFSLLVDIISVQDSWLSETESNLTSQIVPPSFYTYPVQGTVGVELIPTAKR